MRIDRFTHSLQTALSDAQSLAIGQDHNFLEPSHLLATMLEQKQGSIRPLLQQAGCQVDSLRQNLKNTVENLPKVEGVDADVHMSNDLGRVLNIADKL